MSNVRLLLSQSARTPGGGAVARKGEIVMPLPTGSWEINVAGTLLHLNLNAIRADGSLDANLERVTVEGFWDERTQKITFARNETGADGVVTPQVFTGYHFIDGLDDPTALRPFFGVGSYAHRLAGFFESFSGPATRIMRGWYAQRTVSYGGDVISPDILRP